MSTEPRFRIPLPPNGEWTEADLDALRADVPYRTEIVDGNLIVSPRPSLWHNDVIRVVANALVAAAPPGLWAYLESEIRWSNGEYVRHSLAPDVLVAPRHLRDERQRYAPPDLVQLVVEVESPSSTNMDRETKPLRYAELGIRSMWRIEDGPKLVEYRLTRESGAEIVQTVTTGTFTTEVPFRVTLDLDILR
ncbi:Uma2 family endonuclease [Cryptosporangium aurantiacum]|uniref:Endonuclease, Uma2 family (Restriction endonuclease fold) n=1 Tax=Cryptosporangium aurantiacum TaxID=134849 RepID=A0A1M7QD06_9ACTN|nr:Uma2 family endonuclease [Cryptosporangium aurantiacum]SHN28587.1 Endonuclease, Uma2 family (restriction endonuclease fold) [Cryptosporangium aurantiacum]